MILETQEIKEGILKCSGIELTQWLNNRFIRTSADHSIKEYLLTAKKPGDALKWIVQNFCMPSSYLNGTTNIGIPTNVVVAFPVPELEIGAIDIVDQTATDFAIPFGPVYDILKQIATSYLLGIRVVRFEPSADTFKIKFEVYKGLDRTSIQSVNPTLRFSPKMDTFDPTEELYSVADHKSLAITFAPAAQSMSPTAQAVGTNPGAPSFNLRAAQVFADDVTPASVGSNATTLANVLYQRGILELFNHRLIQLVDGEIVQNGQIVYGSDYFLGDIIETEGNTGIINRARVTEYIRSQDREGKKEYPTLSVI
jgi:hypothetical protein